MFINIIQVQKCQILLMQLPDKMKLPNESNDFVFIVNDDEFWCNHLMADFISPIITLIHMTDPLMYRFTIEGIQDSSKFKLVYSLMKGESIDLTPANYLALFTIMEQLGNTEILEKLINMSMMGPMERFIAKSDLGIDFDHEVDFIASHFSSFEFDKLDLDLEAIALILSNKNLIIETEDELLKFITHLIETKGKSFMYLLSFIHLENLTLNSLNKLYQLIDPHEVQGAFYDCLYMNIIHSSSISSVCRYKNRIISLPSKDKVGVFQYLAEVAGGNPHLKQMVEVTSSSSISNRPYQVIDIGWVGRWKSNDEENSWIMFDFKKNHVKVSSYMIKTFGCGPGNYHLRSWILEGSDDGFRFEDISKYVDDDSLNGPSYAVIFQSHNFKPFRFIRLRQIGPNHGNDYDLILNNVELYGYFIYEH